MLEADQERMQLSLERKKALISVLLGWIGFAGTYSTFSASFPPHQITIVWSLFLPMLAALAFGWRYALLAATFGGAGFFAFHLWPTNGWANVVNVLIFTSWYLWHGYCAERRRIRPSFWNNLYGAQALYSVYFNLVLFSTYPWIFRFNPPFWAPDAATSMSMGVIKSIAVKETFLLFMQIFLCDLLLNLQPLRRIFSLPTTKASRYTHVIVVSSILIGMAVLVCFFAVHSIMSGERFTGMLAQASSHESRDLMALIVIISLVAGLQLSKYVEKRLVAEDELKTSEERFRAVYDSVNDAIFIHDQETGRILDVNSFIK